jgi:hypothetical protein
MGHLVGKRMLSCQASCHHDRQNSIHHFLLLRRDIQDPLILASILPRARDLYGHMSAFTLRSLSQEDIYILGLQREGKKRN